MILGISLPYQNALAMVSGNPIPAFQALGLNPAAPGAPRKARVAKRHFGNENENPNPNPEPNPNPDEQHFNLGANPDHFNLGPKRLHFG